MKKWLLAGAALLSSAAGAHETTLDSEWCSGRGEQLVLLQHQNWSEADIIAATPVGCDAMTKSCGQLDHDDYSFTRSAAGAHCESLSGAAKAIFFGPDTFLNDEPIAGMKVAKHHVLYSVDQGIEFGCYVCATIQPQPIDR